jgi:hypothetical protein
MTDTVELVAVVVIVFLAACRSDRAACSDRGHGAYRHARAAQLRMP